MASRNCQFFTHFIFIQIIIHQCSMMGVDQRQAIFQSLAWPCPTHKGLQRHDCWMALRAHDLGSWPPKWALIQDWFSTWCQTTLYHVSLMRQLQNPTTFAKYSNQTMFVRYDSIPHKQTAFGHFCSAPNPVELAWIGIWSLEFQVEGLPKNG